MDTKVIVIKFGENNSLIHKIGELSFSKPSKIFFWGLLKKEVDATIKTITITNLSIPPELDIEDEEQFIYLTYSNGITKIKSNKLKNFHLSSNNETINIELNSKLIRDCFSQDNFFNSEISFDVETNFSDDLPLTVKNHRFKIICEKETSIPNLEFELLDNLIDGVEYSHNKSLHLGNILLYGSSEYEYASLIDSSTLDINFTKNGLNEVLYFSEDFSLIENHGNDFSYYLNLIENSLKIDNLKSNNQILIPVFIDLTKINNPIEESIEYVGVTSKFTINKLVLTKEIDFSFSIIPDKRTPALYTLLDDYYDTYTLHDSTDIGKCFKWQSESKSGKENCFNIKIGNVAENGLDILKVNNLKFNFLLSPGSESSILNTQDDYPSNHILSNGLKGSDLNQIFRVNSKPITEIDPMYDFVSGNSSYKEFVISFRHDAIGFIPSERATIHCDFSFDYKIENENSFAELIEEEYTSYNSRITFKIEEYIGDHWLALDFGTSASVASFASGESFEMNRGNPDALLLDLQSSLKKLTGNNGDELNSEKGTKFLSSELVLREGDGIFIQANDYHEDIVCLSPTQDNYNIFEKNRIPYLKSLVGLDHLPDPNNNFAEFEYREKENFDKIKFSDHPLQVSTILKNTYNSFVRDFVYPAIKERDKLNKLIVTVPNTFTPKHLNYIQNILVEKLPVLRKNYIEFISESDAVACDYISNWPVYNEDRHDKMNFFIEEEYILVYDIGAGTTDITYLKIKSFETGDKEVEILGRLGKATAGNYLDYIIAKIIDNDCGIELAYMDTNIGGGIQKEMLLNFKKLIKDHIKPNLGRPFQLYINNVSGELFTENKEGCVEYDCSRIINHPLMNNYIQDNAEKLFESFFNLFGQSSDQSENLKKGNIPINTVIFTGRTILFEKLRLSLIEELREWSKNKDLFFVFNTDSDDLKSIVVKGALQYAMVYRDQENSPVKIKNRNLQARYGILYKDPKAFSTWRFKELLNPNTKPSNPEFEKIKGITIYEYDTDVNNALPIGEEPVIDLRVTNTGFVVQSFSSNTAQDFLEGKMEYITTMYSFSTNQVADPKEKSKVKVRMKITKKNEMLIYIGNHEEDPKAPLRMEIQKNETFKHSMWPYLQSNQSL